MSETHETKEAKMRIEREHEIMPFEDNGENAYIKNLEILAVLTDIVRKHQDMKFEQILDRYIHTRNAAPNMYPTSTDTLKTLELAYDMLG